MWFTRRQFLKSSLIGLGGLYGATLTSRLWAATDDKATQPSEADTAKAEVFEFTEPKLLDEFGNVRKDSVLRWSVHRILAEMTGRDDRTPAWKEFFSKTDIIGIKFQPVATDLLNTSSAMAYMIVHSLLDSGFSARRIMLLEPPPYTAVLETMPAPRGYLEEKVAAGKRHTQFVRALDKVTAILNVPFLKDHRLFGLSCSMVNLALGLINNPGAFFDPGGVPGIPDLVAADAVRKKHRLTIVNAIRGIFDGGPRADKTKVWKQCSILAGTDMVAIDRVAMDILDSARNNRGLKSLAEAGRPASYIAEAGRKGLGIADRARIQVRRVSF